MKPGITSKLFIAILATNVVTALAVGLGVRAAFNSGFDAYLAEREDERLGRLARVLATNFAQYGSWSFLRDNDRLWVALNESVGSAPREDLPIVPGTPAPKAGGGRAPPSIVIDAEGRPVVGRSDPARELARRPIDSGGRVVGWLAAPVRNTAFDLADQRFREQQLRAGWIVALLATLLSAAVAWVLARGLLSPVKRLAAATRRLADGDYATRVEAGRGDELGRLVDDFNRLGNALAKNESSRRDFMADVSHELRTPLAVLKGELEALEDGVRAPTPQTLHSLQAEVATLEKLVDDLHDLALADAGGLAYRFDTVDLAAVVAAGLDELRERCAARGLALESRLGPPVLVHGDAERLAQLVRNLLENSVRYTDPGGRVAIDLREEGGAAVLDVRDSAPGVPEAALPRLFERFYRVEDSRNRARGGSGLGLAIARSVVEAHGGSIAARPSPLGGLGIEVRIPLGKGAP